MKSERPENHTLRALAFLALGVLAVVVFMGKSYEGSLQALDSTTHAMLSLEVTSNGVKPVLPMADFQTNQRTKVVFNDHPFPLFYLSGKVMRALGPEAWTARLVPTAFSVGCVLLTAWLGMLLFSASFGLLAGLILMLSRDFVLIGSRFHLDTPMVFFILLSFILWVKKRPLLSGVAAGLGLWMKTPVAFLIFPAALGALILSGRFSKKEFLNLIYGGLVALAVGSGVWILTGWLGGWDLVADYWTRQVWGTAVGGRGGGGETDHLFGLYLLKRNYFPWFGLLLVSLGALIFKKQWKRLEVALPLVAVGVLELVISSMRFKHYWYFVPVFPFLALLCMVLFEKPVLKYSNSIYTGLIGLALLIPALLLATPLSLGPENFPGLRKFHPLIQAYGNCSDRVLFIDGGQPFGSVLDSIYELGFYTGRKILQSQCQEAVPLILRENPEWIIVSGAHRDQCLNAEVMARYPVEYRFGSQSLFSRKVPKDRALDLTPLARELKPPRGCVPVDLPTDSYFPR